MGQQSLAETNCELISRELTFVCQRGTLAYKRKNVQAGESPETNWEAGAHLYGLILE